jgi:hypothetical protein
MIERDDEGFETWPAEVADPVKDAISNLLVAIMESTTPGSRERAKASAAGVP